MSASHRCSMGQSHASSILLSSCKASHKGDVRIWTMYLAGHSPASQLWPGVHGDFHLVVDRR